MAKGKTLIQGQQGIEDGLVAVGVFAGTHGVKGDVKLKSFTAEPDAILAFEKLLCGEAKDEIFVQFSKVVKGGLVVSVAGVDNLESAQSLNGKTLYVPRDSFTSLDDEDEFYLADLIGLRVKNTNGKELGIVRAIENFGSDDLLDILLKEPSKGIGKSLMLPFTFGYVPKVNISAQQIVIDLDAWLADQSEVTGEKEEKEG